MQLRDHSIVAPGGGGEWVYYQNETGFWMRKLIFNDLVSVVLRHRQNNNLPLVTPPYGGIVEEIDDWYCKRMSEATRQRLCTDVNVGPYIPQPGDLLSNLIFKLTGQVARNCGVCGVRMRDMNNWGWVGCWKRRKTVFGWLRAEAAKRGHSINEAQAYSLFRAAWLELRSRGR